MTNLRRLHLYVFAAGLLIGIGVQERERLFGWMMEPAHGAGDILDEGYSPAQYTGGVLPAELLALADWPLDPDAMGRLPPPQPLTDVEDHAHSSDGAPDDVAIAVPAVPAAPHEAAAAAVVEERTWRPVVLLRKILGEGGQGRGGDEPVSTDASTSRRSPEPALFSGMLVADAELDKLRGGFEMASGLVMSFGIERLVYVNGNLASMTRLNVADLGQLSGGGLDPSKLSVGSTLAVIQNGPNNTFVPDTLASGAFATVIQNSLDNQRIQSVTTISATVNSLDMLRANRFGESLRSAVSGAMIR